MGINLTVLNVWMSTTTQMRWKSVDIHGNFVQRQTFVPSPYRILTPTAVVFFARVNLCSGLKDGLALIQVCGTRHEYVGLEGFATAPGRLGPPPAGTTVVSSFILIFEPPSGGLYAGT